MVPAAVDAHMSSSAIQMNAVLSPPVAGRLGLGVQPDGSLGSISPPFAGMKSTAVT